MNYLVLGLPKSGTSALHAAIKTARNPLCLFEPTRADQIEFLLAREADHRLAKVMLPVLDQLAVPANAFDKTVLIVRDPRDVLVSWLLYRPLLRHGKANPAFIADFLAALRRKEADPQSMSVRSLFDILDRHQVPYTRGREFRKHFNMVKAFDEKHADHFTIRYEDYVEGNVDDLEAYLGLPANKKARVGSHISYNERSKKHGAWRHWFTPEDEEVWRSFFQPFIEHYGYATDWTREDRSVIDPETSSRYVERNLERLRSMPNTYGNLKEKRVYTEEYVRVLESAISDGLEGAMIELALAYKYGWGLPESVSRVLELISEAAERGNPVAMIHLGIMHERGDGVPLDEARAKELFARAGASYGNKRAQRAISSLRELYPESGAPLIQQSA